MQLIGFMTLCLIWGTTWLAIKFSLDGFPPFLGAAVRFTVAALAVGAMLLVKKKSLRISKSEFKIMVIASFLMYVFDYGLIYWGEQTLSAGVTAIFFATFALFTALWSVLFLKNEQLTPLRWVGIFLGIAGITIIFYDQLEITQFNRMVTLSIIAVILAAAGGSLSNVLVKRHLQKMDARVITFYQMSMGIVFLYAIGFIIEDPTTINITPKVAGAVFYLAIIGSAFAFVLYYNLLKTMSTVTLSLIIYVTPLIALMIDFLLYRQMIPLRSVGGMVLIFSGIGLVQRLPTRKNKALKKPTF